MEGKIVITTLNFENDQAKATLTNWGNGTVALSDLSSNEKRKGYATQLLQEIVEHADENNLEIFLIVKSENVSDGFTNKLLEDFYRKFGFKSVDKRKEPTIMIRHTIMPR